MANVLVVSGITLALVGIFLKLHGHIALPFLPGDIFIQNEQMTVYVPVTTSILLSIIITVLIRIFR